jgi:hypothetical protein
MLLKASSEMSIGNSRVVVQPILMTKSRKFTPVPAPIASGSQSSGSGE